MGAGQAFLTYPHVVTHYAADQDDPWLYSWIAFYRGGGGLSAGTDFTDPGAAGVPDGPGADALSVCQVI
ncbi:AraC family ligand binding domain-containing protein [Paenibacillus rhizoplanae]